MLSVPYSRGFYERLRDGATRSAEVIVPLVLQFVPASRVVDIGCGDGSWLEVFRKNGVREVVGIDGDYVDRDLLRIPKECFRAGDLTEPFEFDTKFDLAISLEVAEHLPAKCAAVFVEGLTKLAPAVLFSAAIPFQGGDGHVNEQWPEKWAKLFEERGYVAVDCIRKRVWKNEAVEWWYAQNALLFVETDLVQRDARLKAEFEKTIPDQLCLIHPRHYRQAVARGEQSLVAPGVRAATRHLVSSLIHAVKRRLVRS